MRRIVRISSRNRYFFLNANSFSNDQTPHVSTNKSDHCTKKACAMILDLIVACARPFRRQTTAIWYFMSVTTMSIFLVSPWVRHDITCAGFIIRRQKKVSRPEVKSSTRLAGCSFERRFRSFPHAIYHMRRPAPHMHSLHTSCKHNLSRTCKKINLK